MLKYEIRWFTINFSKDLAKTKKSKQYALENQLKVLESNLNCDINTVEYINCKDQLKKIYDDITESAKVRSRCQWYENGEKLTKFFLNLEKAKAMQCTIKKLEINHKQIDNSAEINKLLERFFENYVKENLEKRNMHTMNFLEIFHCRP